MGIELLGVVFQPVLFANDRIASNRKEDQHRVLGWLMLIITHAGDSECNFANLRITPDMRPFSKT